MYISVGDMVGLLQASTVYGILEYCDKKFLISYIEDTNLKAINIIRCAYGYRDKEYMKLKIIQGCSSMGVFKPDIYPLHHNPG
ncbi:MAG TPA: hypothetical protein PLC43_06090 [Caldisericia bacterium]|nr:hypothetical protein [Caldisericia bacterium]